MKRTVDFEMSLSEGRTAAVYATGNLLPPDPANGVHDRDVRNVTVSFRIFDAQGLEVVDTDFFVKRTIEREAIERLTEV